MSDPARAPEADTSKRRTHSRIEYPVLNKMLILHLDTGTIPFGKIIREQWSLRSRYPWRDR